jgi:MFS family permease
MAIGIGAVLVAVTSAANTGVSEDKAGLAASLLNASQQLGTALGLAIFSAIATARTSTLLAVHAPRDAALTAGLPPRPAGVRGLPRRRRHRDSRRQQPRRTHRPSQRHSRHPRPGCHTDPAG